MDEESSDQVLEDVAARNVYTKYIMWNSTDFLRHVVGETEGRGATMFTYRVSCRIRPFLGSQKSLTLLDTAGKQDWAILGPLAF